MLVPLQIRLHAGSANVVIYDLLHGQLLAGGRDDGVIVPTRLFFRGRASCGTSKTRPGGQPTGCGKVGWQCGSRTSAELVGDIRRMVEQARARHQRGHPDAPFRATEPFEPVEWLGWYLHKGVGRHTGGSETQRQIFDLANAWDRCMIPAIPLMVASGTTG
jgi:hypothetical protein